MNQYTCFINCVKENYDIITQMLMFKNQTVDNPIFKFLLNNLKNTVNILNENYLPKFKEEKEFFEDLLKRSIELSFISNEVLNNKTSMNLLFVKIKEYAILHEDWIIKYKLYLCN